MLLCISEFHGNQQRKGHIFLIGINSQGIFHFSIASGMALGTTESPMSTGVSFLGGTVFLGP